MKAKPMKFDGVKTYSVCQPHEATHVSMCCPGPFWHRLIPVILKGSRKDTGCWTWNGDTEKPTLKPSLLTRGTRTLTAEERSRVLAGEKLNPQEIICHSWITDGKVIFLNDSTHDLAGQTLDLEDVENSTGAR